MNGAHFLNFQKAQCVLKFYNIFLSLLFFCRGEKTKKQNVTLLKCTLVYTCEYV